MRRIAALVFVMLMSVVPCLAQIPTHWDWREQGKVTPVKNQGGCGSNWAFASVAVVESKLLILQNLTTDLSEQELVSCAAKTLGKTGGIDSCASGGYPGDALEYIRLNGIASEASFPYQGKDLACPASLPPSVAQIDGYYTVAVDPNSTANTIQNIKQAIYTDGPVVATIEVYADLDSYSSGVYTHTTGSLMGGHTVALVGYDDVGAYWIAKNSWGPLWGESGYVQISYNANIGMYQAGYLIAVQRAFALTVLPPISANPNPVSFGNVNVGSSSTQTVILTINNGMTISSVQANGDYSVSSNSCTPLPYTVLASSTCTLQLQFAPTMPGQRWSALMVTDNTSTNYTFGLEGTGVGSALAFTPGIISSVVGNGTAGFIDGTAASAELDQPAGVAVDSAGNLYIADQINQRIRRLDTSGNISTVAGNGTAGFIDGTAASAELDQPAGVAVDSAGNLYIADQINQRIRKLDANGNISTVAGSGTAGFAGDGAAAVVAELNQPTGVAVDNAGNLYIADNNNQRIRKVDTGGNISTVAGNGIAGFAGNGTAAIAAELNQPAGVAVDSAGNLYIADQNNQRIRKVDTSGNISTVTSIGNAGVAVDSAGNLYIADQNNQRIRKVDTGGNISTVAGNGIAGFAGNGTAAIAAELNQPAGVAVDSAGNLYIADQSNQRIRKVDVTKSMLSFGMTNVGQVSSPQTIQISNVGTAALNLIAPLNSTTAFSFPSSFQSQSVGNDCVTGTPLAVGVTCSLGVVFDLAAQGNPLTGTLTVTDDAFNSQQAVSLTGSITGAGPTITSASSAIFTVGTSGNFTVTTAGLPTPSITENGALPSGLNFVDHGDGTGALSGTPASGTAGAYAITIAASNGVSPNATQNFTVNVLNNMPTGALPAHWDWREQGAVTPVKNQGGCGSPWAFAPVAVVESKLLILQNLTMILSEQELVSCAAQKLGSTVGDSCNGGWPTDALNYIQSYGIASTASFPYQGTNLACPANLPPSVAQIDGFSYVNSDPQSIKQAIYTDGPVVATIEVYADLDSYSSGVYTHTTGSLLGLHNVALVGYDDAGQYWIAKNSWGTGWGESGYIRISYNANIGMYQYNPIAVQRSFALSSPAQTITFGSLPTKTYGDAPFSISASASSGLEVGFNASGSCSVSTNTVTITGAGSCSITASQAGGGTYSPAPPVTQSFTVNQAALTVTANNQSKTYDGTPFSPFTVSYIGFVNIESASMLTGTQSFSGSAVGASDAGTYTITPGGLSSNNYAITFVNGTLTINQANANITVNDYSGVYDGNPHGANGTATGVQGEDLSTLLNLGSSFTSVPGGTANWSFAGNTDYKPASGSVNISITKATPIITWGTPAAIPYGTSLHATQLNATANASGGGMFTYNPAAGAILNAGNYTLSVTFSPADATDYTTATATVTLTVNPAALTVTANNGTRPYGQANPGLTVTYTGLLNGDTAATFNTAPNTPPTLATTATTASPAGSYPITVTGATDPNYSITFVNGTLTIGAAASSTVVVSSLTPALYGQMITFMATVTNATSGSSGTPTGTVTFLDGGAAFGTSSLNPSGQAAYSTSALPGGTGTQSITAVYSGDANFGGSTSSAILQTITAAPVVSLEPDAITFHSEDVNTTSAPIPVVLTNQGNAALAISGIQISGGNNGDFSIVSNNCGSSLAALSSCTVSVVFSPRDTGTRTSSLSFSDNNDGIANSNQVISLTGSALSVVSANFTRQPIAAGNTIWFDSVFSAKTPRGPDGVQEMDLSNHTVNVYVTNGAITFTANTTTYNLPVPDAMITFTPTVTAATTTFDAVNNRWVTTVPAADLTKRMQQFDIPGEAFASGIAFPVPAGGLPGGISNVAWSAAFTTDTPGVTLRWEWGAAVYSTFSTNYNVLGVGVKSGDDGKGHCQWDGNGDRAGTPENFKQYLVMGATADGPRDYTGDFTRDVGVVPSVTIVSITPIPVVFAMPQAQNSTSSPTTVTITNIHQSMNLTIASVAVNGDFAVSALSSSCPTGTTGFTLAPGTSCAFNVTFAPADMGTRTGQLTFTLGTIAGMNADDVPPPQKVDLVGTGAGGTAPIAALSQLSLNFGREENATTSTPQTVMLVNAGGAQLNITNINIAQPSGDFAITSSTCVSSLAPAANCLVGVSFTPTTIGQRTGALTFTYDSSNLSGQSQSVNLTGKGTP